MTNTGLRFSGPMPPANFNMARYCLRGASSPRDKPALIVVKGLGDAEIWTYGDVEAAVLSVAYWLRSVNRLPVGCRILIRLKNHTFYPLVFFGAIAGGLIPIPVSPELTERELSFVLDDSEAAAIVLDDELPHGAFDPSCLVIPAKSLAAALEAGAAAEYAQTAADDPAFLIYTSGTTARPKGVLHAHRSAWGRRPMYQGWYGIKREDRLMHAGSFNWTYTLGTGLADPWANGATAIVYVGEKDPALWPLLMREYGVSLFAAVPGVYRQILKYSAADHEVFATLRHGLTAGEALSETLDSEWRERTGKLFYEALGQSELSTYISSAPAVPPKKGKIGKPQAGRCVAILPEEGGVEPLAAGQPGLIAVHRTDPGLMLGYWRRPEEEKHIYRGEWFLGGDAGVMDEDGYIAHLGRHNELMNAGGFRVSPAEVEQELAKYPGVAEVAVCEACIRDGVSIIRAFVVPRVEAESSLVSGLAAFAGSVLAAYKCPKDYVMVQSLPRTANGKLKRAELKKFTPETK